MYSLEDLVLFTTEGWFGLYQTINAQYWPLHLLSLTWVLLTFYSLVTQKQGLIKIAIAGFACLWISCGAVFHWGEYQQLSWVAVYYGWAFILQGVALLITAGLYRSDFSSQRVKVIGKKTGYFLLFSGLFVVPLLGLIEGRSWSAIDVVGVGPDSTALSTLGLIVISIRHSILRLLLCCIPTLWLIVSAATAWPMGLLQGLLGLFFWVCVAFWLIILSYISSSQKKV